jgi:hypothetical protein
MVAAVVPAITSPSPTVVSSLAEFRQFLDLLDNLADRELRGEPGLVALPT